MQVTLQVKTLKGMHTVTKDAWGAHSQYFKKWGAQLTPNTTTRRKLEKFRNQWKQFVRGTSLASEEGAPLPLGAEPALMKGGDTSLRPHQEHNKMLENYRKRSNMPWMFKEVLAPPAAEAMPPWSPVAGPLSSMAQLSAGMLPLTRSSTATTSSSPSLSGPTPTTRDIRIKKEPEGPTGASTSTFPRGPEVSPISSADEKDIPLDLTYAQRREELEKEKREFTEKKEARRATALALAKEKEELQAQLLEMDMKIERLESIPLEQFNRMGQVFPPMDIKEEENPEFTESPSSPCNTKEEEAMDQGADLRPNPSPQPPPLEPVVKVTGQNNGSSEEEDVKEMRRNSWTKRREAAQRKRLFLKLVKHSQGPNSLEVYRVPSTPHSPPNPLFPTIESGECSDCGEQFPLSK